MATIHRRFHVIGLDNTSHTDTEEEHMLLRVQVTDYDEDEAQPDGSLERFYPAIVDANMRREFYVFPIEKKMIAYEHGLRGQMYAHFRMHEDKWRFGMGLVIQREGSILTQGSSHARGVVVHGMPILDRMLEVQGKKFF